MNNQNRYEVTATMPYFTHLLKGDILVPKHHPLAGDCWGTEDEEDVTKWVTFCPDYPHLFRLLKWWERGPVDELPKYVKFPFYGWNAVYKINEWIASKSHKGEYFTILTDGDNECQAWLPACIPSTEAEYNEYINKLNSK